MTPQQIIRMLGAYAHLWDRVRGHMGWSNEKTSQWFTTRNPMLGDVTPLRMAIIGAGPKLERWIESAIRGGP